MDVHEYQAKELLASFGVPVPKGAVAFSPDQAVYAATELGGWNWAVKAQIHAGARGKAGGIKICKTYHEVRDAAAQPARQAAGHHPDRPRRQARAAGLYRGGRAVRSRALSRLRARPQSRAHPRHRLAARRHGDRGDRQGPSPKPSSRWWSSRRSACRPFRPASSPSSSASASSRRRAR